MSYPLGISATRAGFQSTVYSQKFQGRAAVAGARDSLQGMAIHGAALSIRFRQRMSPRHSLTEPIPKAVLESCVRVLNVARWSPTELAITAGTAVPQIQPQFIRKLLSTLRALVAAFLPDLRTNGDELRAAGPWKLALDFPDNVSRVICPSTKRLRRCPPGTFFSQLIKLSDLFGKSRYQGL